jgi:hypothetical protein
LYKEFLKVADSKKEVMEEDLQQIAKQYQSESAVA